MNKTIATMLPFIILLVIPVAAILLIKSKAPHNDGMYRTDQGYKILCRSQSNRVFAGVCGGIAEYFGWSAVVVRLFFLLTGVGLFTYMVLAIVIPESPSKLL
jgi:phage shock protein C